MFFSLDLPTIVKDHNKGLLKKLNEFKLNTIKVWPGKVARMKTLSMEALESQFGLRAERKNQLLKVFICLSHMHSDACVPEFIDM